MATREWLDGQVYPLVSLQVVVTVEALRALIATEWSVVGRVGVTCLSTVQVLHLCHMAAVERHSHLVRHAADEGELAVGVADVGEGTTRW